MTDRISPGSSINSGSSPPELVLMPWDDKSQIFVKGTFAPDEIVPRWEFILRKLRGETKIENVVSLINVINSYNVTSDTSKGLQEKPPWKFHALKMCFKEMTDGLLNQFFCENGIISTIQQLVVRSQEIIPEVKLLKCGKSDSNSLHQLQVATLLANAFFCTYPPQLAGYPSINFDRLFDGHYTRSRKPNIEKIKCILNYFRRIKENYPTGQITYYRLCTRSYDLPKWETLDTKLSELKVENEDSIENQHGYLQMDFANKFVGGGILGRGALQEEIRFAISPELIASRLFTECLGDNEALLVVGAERYSDYTGYGDKFRFTGDYQDKTPFDEKNHRKSYVIMLDALYFVNPCEQFLERRILRELNKAYIGFQQIEPSRGLPLATGNWGCGAFHGDPQLKSIIQLMASSQAGRNMLYLTFGNANLRNEIHSLYEFLKERRITVGQLYKVIRQYHTSKRENQSLFRFVDETVSNDSINPDIFDEEGSDNGEGISDRKSSDLDQYYKLVEKRMRTSSVAEGTSSCYIKNELKTDVGESINVLSSISSSDVEMQESLPKTSEGSFQFVESSKQGKDEPEKFAETNVQKSKTSTPVSHSNKNNQVQTKIDSFFVKSTK